MTKVWSDLPPDLVTILRRSQELRKFGMLYVCFLEDGTVQASVQRRGHGPEPHGGNINKDAVMAIINAMGPEAGESWAEHLKAPAQPKKRASVPRVKPTDDDFSDVI